MLALAFIEFLLGPAGGFKTPFGSAGAGLVTFDIFKTGASNSKGIYNTPVDEKGHNFAEVSVNIFNKNAGIGGKIDWVNNTILPNGHGNGSNGNTDLLLASSYDGHIEWDVNIGPKSKSLGIEDEIGDISAPKLKAKASLNNKSESGFMLETVVGVKAIFGIEVKLKLGYNLK